MADSDFNIIKPVEGLPAIQGLTPTTRQQERKRRQRSPGERGDENPEKRDETTEQQTHGDDGDLHCIDYCA
jgi:hypothetical protein